MATAEHGRAYFISMGVEPCQAQTPEVTGGSSGLTAQRPRSIDGIRVAESIAWAHFVEGDLTTSESFYWPTIPPDVVSTARALRDRLADPTQSAAYQALLPAEAQGQGTVVIHHSSIAAGKPFISAAAYDVYARNPTGRGSTRSFDENGAEVSAAWW